MGVGSSPGYPLVGLHRYAVLRTCIGADRRFLSVQPSPAVAPNAKVKTKIYHSAGPLFLPNGERGKIMWKRVFTRRFIFGTIKVRKLSQN